MCAFHHIRQTGSLFERGEDRTGCVPWLKTVFVQGGKNTKVSEFTIEEFGKFGKVVLTRLVLRNAMGVRFEEGVALRFGLEKVRKRKISCFWGGHRFMIYMFLKIYESFERKQ